MFFLDFLLLCPQFFLVVEVVEEAVVEMVGGVSEPKINTYDYTTTTTPIDSEYIDNYQGGVIEIIEEDSLINSTKLTIPSGALLEDSLIEVGEVNNPPELPRGLNYVGAPVDFNSDESFFNQSLILEIPYHNESLSDAGIPNELDLKLFHYDKSNKSWNENPIISIDTVNNKITAEIDHFSYYAITGLIGIPDKDLGVPQPGDLLFKTGLLGPGPPSGSWMPGHVGIYTGEKIYPNNCSGSDEKNCLASEDVKNFRIYNVIEALKDGVQYSYYDIPNVTETHEGFLKKFEGDDLYMGARESKDFLLTSKERVDIVSFVENQIGKPYAWEQTVGVFFGMLSGSLVKGQLGKFNCVGLAEAAYEYAGVNGGVGLTTFSQEDEGVTDLPAALTPAEQYNMTRPARGGISPLEKIAFISNRDGNTEIYAMNSDGSEQTKLTNNNMNFWGGLKWSSYANKIAFCAYLSSKNFKIYTINIDGSEQTVLTDNSYDNSDPSWSPDGEKITYELLAFSGDSPNIYAMNSDGSKKINLTNNSYLNTDPTWSPDGEKIAFISWESGDYEIYSMNSDGSGRTNLTNNPSYHYSPTWSPDGKKIIFISDRDGNDEIYVMNSDGSEQTKLTNNPSYHYSPTWSPDGKKIAFISDRDGNDEIYVMNSDGSEQTKLTNNPSYDSYPRWSPDGKKIAFISNRDGNNEVYVMNSDGNNQINLTNNPSSDFRPEWSQ
jgi:Tol biopolymer transport system component